VPHLQDLRLHDNPALSEAVRMAQQQGGHVSIVYVHSPEEDGEPGRTALHGMAWYGWLSVRG
jgi:deoxyribodipyrimidine photolyase